MKSKTRKFLFGFGAFALILATAGFASGGSGRTKSYFGAYHALYGHAPASIRPYLDVADLLLSPVFEKIGIFEPVWTQVEPGIKMKLDPYDLVSRKLLEVGVWEPQSIQAVADHLSPNATFIDVGAHIGYYSLKAATIIGPNGHILSIEPNPQTLPKLRGNIEASQADAVSVWPVACAQSESTLQFFAAPESNTGESSLSKDNASQEGAAAVSYSVQARPLDAIVKEAKLDRIDVIKIDVEGAEFEVLKGAATILDSYRPVLVMELMPNQLKSMGTSMDEVNRYLVSHGYSLSRQLGNANFEYVPTKASAQLSY
jgi:FkbM family methyltransferase